MKKPEAELVTLLPLFSYETLRGILSTTKRDTRGLRGVLSEKTNKTIEQIFEKSLLFVSLYDKMRETNKCSECA